MLEIVILWTLGKKVAGMCRDRGRKPLPWVVLLVLAWYGGAMVGFVACAVGFQIANPGQKDPPLVPLLISALGTAALGVTLVVVIVSLLPRLRDKYDDEEYDDEDEPDDRPAPRTADPYAEYDRRYRDDEDDDYRPARRR